jgi:H+/Cl- antiporter ClcA
MSNPVGPPDPLALIRSRPYAMLLLVVAALGVPIAVIAYFILKLIALMQQWVFTDLPNDLGFSSAPTWWPVVPLTVAGVVVGLTIRLLPGRGGELPVEGFHPGGMPKPVNLPGVAVTAVVSIGLGAVIGPEAPLIAIGAGLAFLMVRPIRNMPDSARAVVAASGSFAAISTMLGTPLAAAFLLMEASGLGGALATAALLPGLLAAGIGALIFTGLDSATGFGTFSLAIPNLPSVGAPTVAEFGYAVALGAVAAGLCWAIRRLATTLGGVLARHLVAYTTVVGVGIAVLAIIYAEATGHPTSDVLFSGQVALPHLVDNSAEYSVGALLMLIACKGLAYSGALVGFRGGPTFPALFLGAAGGVAASHLPGLTLIGGVAIGLGAMTVGILRLPFTAVLLTTLFLGSDAFAVIPLTIVAVVVSHVVTARIAAPTASAPVPGQRAAPSDPVTISPGAGDADPSGHEQHHVA